MNAFTVIIIYAILFAIAVLYQTIRIVAQKTAFIVERLGSTAGGGIQLMSKFSEKFGSNELVPVPEEEICSDEKRNEAAVNLALFGLSDRSE